MTVSNSDPSRILNTLPSNQDVIIISEFYEVIGDSVSNFHSSVREIKFNSPSQLKIINSRAFSYCSYLYKFEFEKCLLLEEIGAYAFDSCQLISINLNNCSNLKIIRDYVFKNCPIQNITLPNSLIELGEGVFSYCYNLNNIFIPSDCGLTIIPGLLLENTRITNFYITPSIEFINMSAFLYCYNLKEIHLDPLNENFIIVNNSILSYDEKRFVGIFPYQTEIILPNSLEVIGPYSFYQSEVKYLVISSSIKIIDQYAFSESRIKNIIFPDDCILEKICEYSFYSCNLDNINLSLLQKLSTIEPFAFDQATINNFCFPQNDLFKNIYQSYRLMSVEIPIQVEYIHEFAFSGSPLFNIKFQEDCNLIIIDNYAFAGCYFHQITIPISVVYINEGAFIECFNLKNIKINENSDLKFIGPFAFVSCSIQSFFISENLLNIDGTAFIYNNNIKFYISSKNPIYKSDNNFLYSNKNETLHMFLNSNINCEIPHFIKKIGAYSFAFSIIENIKISKCVKIIEEYAFANSQIKNVTFEQNIELEEIGDDAFGYYGKVDENDENIDKTGSIYLSSSLKRVGQDFLYRFNKISTILIESENNLEIINDFAFAYLPIQSITLTNIKFIGKRAFDSCTLLNSITFKEECSLTNITDYTFSNTNITSIEIPSTVVEIGEYAFSDCLSLIEIKFRPNSKISIIHDYAFSKTNITSIKFDSCLRILGNFIFSESAIRKVNFSFDCYINIIGSETFSKSELKEINIPDAVTIISDLAFSSLPLENIIFSNNSRLIQIGDGAFTHTNIRNIIIPKTVKTIGKSSFASSLLESISMPLSIIKIGIHAFENTNLQNISFENGSQIEEIADYLFYQTKLKSFFINSNIKKIGTWSFSNCHTLCNIEFSNDSMLTEIGEFAFAWTSIVLIKFPKTLTYIGQYCFYYCQNLSKISIESTNITEINEFVFASCNFSKFIIPNSITNIHRGAFSSCQHLTEFTFTADSQLMNFSLSSLYKTNVTSIEIPSTVISFGLEYMNGYYSSIKNITFKENSKLIEFDWSYPPYLKLDYLLIPKSVLKICDFCFESSKINQVDFYENSQLIEIGKYAFAYSKI